MEIATQPISGLKQREFTEETSANSAPARTVERQRIAILSTWHPEPADNGRKQRTKMLISAFAETYDIILISMLDSSQMDGGRLAYIDGVVQMYMLEMPAYDPHSQRAVLAALRRYPRSLVATWDPKVAAAINDIVRRHRVDLAIGTDMRTMRYLTALPDNVLSILDEPDVSPFVTDCSPPSHRFKHARRWLRERKYRRLLKEHAPGLATVFVASQAEADAYRTLSPSQPVEVIENCVPALPDRSWRPTDSTNLLFTGSITYSANAEGVRFFINDVLPAVTCREPDLQLVVTGSLPEQVPSEMRDPNLRFTGRLDSLEDQYLNSRLFVAPILSGTGTRIKLLEAMSYGMPIVSTSKGAEGLPVHHEVHLLIADDGGAFAAAILRLLDEPELLRTLGQNGRELVEREFTGERQRAQIRKIVHELLSRKQG